jgi:hypothetical protein
MKLIPHFPLYKHLAGLSIQTNDKRSWTKPRQRPQPKKEGYKSFV